MGDNQLNKLYSDAIMAACNGKKPDEIKGLPGLDAEGGTPNQKKQRAALLLWRYSRDEGSAGLDAPDRMADLEEAAQRCHDLFDSQDLRGHGQIAGANEFWSDSHAPIDYIAMAFMTLVAGDLAGDQRGKVRAIGHSILQRCIRWWRRELYLWLLHLDPVSGRGIGVGARWKLGWNSTRDACMKMIRSGQPAEEGLLNKARRWRDTFALVIVADLIAKHGPLHGVTAMPPVRLPIKLQVDRFASGHVSRVIAGELGAGDPRIVWTSYATGEIGTGEPPAAFRGPVERVTL